VKCKVLEWLSRPAFKSQPYQKEWRNRKLHQTMLAGINSFLGTSFVEEDIAAIYQHLGNAVRHDTTVGFVANGFSMEWLRANAN